ncbi:acyl-CoA desaturase [Kibdelosporangium aridum]|uniref:Acyl-CoA desaturase n=1 Tax=Kibdelosporangium aridum TaxID=2030 RepID=A0A428ZU79_KIBAR|nr:acyl-CoA desaturase [Kibdelosporangium aridum]RSM91577.1 acyl-CoA desaturase [Kibdelosporangium aridum]
MTGFPVAPIATRGSDFAELARHVKQAGLLHRRIGYYAARISANVVMLAAGAVVFVMLGDSWWQLFTAAYVAIVLTQFAFIGHDAGHHQILRTRRGNDIIGYTHGALTGISYGWWIGKHTRHHANPNQEDADPDIDIPALAFSEEQAEAKQGFLRWVAKYQAFLFLPLLMTQAVMLKAGGIEALARRQVKAVTVEAALLAGHLAVYITAVFLVLSPGQAVLFIVVHQAVMGVYLGCSFAPNHKGMPILPAGQKVDFLRKQVLTSRNIAGGRWVDFLLGGLNYQIEHHLFPNMPRPNLRRAQPLVRAFCHQRDVSYTECTIVASYAWVLRHLHTVGAPLRVRN